MPFGLQLGTIFALSLIIQVTVWVPSAIFKTERFYDLTGSTTFLVLTATSLWYLPTLPNQEEEGCRRAEIGSAMLAVWALRLGSFLFLRILHDGEDKRFKNVRGKPVRFLIFWTIQGVWCFTVGLCVYVGNLSRYLCERPLGVAEITAIGIWAFGFLFEVVADLQKLFFRHNPKNKDKFIQSGLWALSRHPNYFGEITLWTGLALYSALGCEFLGQSVLCFISPAFTAFLLIKVSGVPLLEKAGKLKWKDVPEYTAYLARTPVLVPKFF